MSTKAFKAEKLEAMKEKLAKVQVAILTEYKGYSVEEITNLRRALQKEGGDYMVTKNTLAKLALKDSNFEPLSELMTGATAIAFGYEDQVAPSKVLAKFIKESKKGAVPKKAEAARCRVNGGHARRFVFMQILRRDRGGKESIH